MSNFLVVNVALTGCLGRKANNPALPLTPAEVAEDARRCAGEGASVFHVHARDAAGNPAWGAEAYRAYVDAVRETVPGAVVCASTSGRHARDFGMRAAAVYSGPDLASLTLGSVDFRDATSENSRATVEGLLWAMREQGVRPECELFDLGHVYRLQELADDGKLARPIYANLILGVCLPATRWALSVVTGALLDRDVVWSGTGIGERRWSLIGEIVVQGGHVRVGLEDSSRSDAQPNAEQVRRVVRMARALGREPATPAQARGVLGL